MTIVGMIRHHMRYELLRMRLSVRYIAVAGLLLIATSWLVRPDSLEDNDLSFINFMVKSIGIELALPVVAFFSVFATARNRSELYLHTRPIHQWQMLTAKVNVLFALMLYCAFCYGISRKVVGLDFRFFASCGDLLLPMFFGGVVGYVARFDLAFLKIAAAPLTFFCAIFIGEKSAVLQHKLGLMPTPLAAAVTFFCFAGLLLLCHFISKCRLKPAAQFSISFAAGIALCAAMIFSAPLLRAPNQLAESEIPTAILKPRFEFGGGQTTVNGVRQGGRQLNFQSATGAGNEIEWKHDFVVLDHTGADAEITGPFYRWAKRHSYLRPTRVHNLEPGQDIELTGMVHVKKRVRKIEIRLDDCPPVVEGPGYKIWLEPGKTRRFGNTDDEVLRYKLHLSDDRHTELIVTADASSSSGSRSQTSPILPPLISRSGYVDGFPRDREPTATIEVWQDVGTYPFASQLARIPLEDGHSPADFGNPLGRRLLSSIELNSSAK